LFFITTAALKKFYFKTLYSVVNRIKGQVYTQARPRARNVQWLWIISKQLLWLAGHVNSLHKRYVPRFFIDLNL